MRQLCVSLLVVAALLVVSQITPNILHVQLKPQYFDLALINVPLFF